MFKPLEKKRLKTPKELGTSIRSLFNAIFIALVVRFFLLTPFVIPSGSMIPTLLVGDYLFVTCFSYGYSKLNLPFGYMLPELNGRIFDWNKPKHGDPVVFRPPFNTKMDYVKRIMAVPGDKVQLKNGAIHLNGKALKIIKKGHYERRADENGKIVKGTLYEQTFPNGTKHTFLKQEPFGQAVYDDTPVYEVPEGHYFVMGDNRDGSSDSRAMHTIGFIPHDHLIGKPFIIWFSTDGRARWWELTKWLPSIRFTRFFQFIM